jgi:4'-phosphopantetheinyl transferase
MANAELLRALCSIGNYKIVILHILPFAECSTLDATYSASLSSEERWRMSALRSESDRQRFERSHGYARQVLGEYLGVPGHDVPLERSATGKPLIRGRQELAFSLAHCETHAVVAVASHALVGVDVEHHHSVKEALGISRRYFAREEADLLDRQAPQELDAAFLRLWVCKEAFIKAIGLGLSYPLDRVIVGGFDGEHPYYSAIDEPHGQPLHWTLTLIERERSYIAVAVKTLPQQTSPQ